MNLIVRKERLSDEVFEFEVKAEDIVNNALPGQFVVVKGDDDESERIPLTIADMCKDNGTITMVIQAVGESTHHLVKKNKGEYFAHILGPLGMSSEIENFGKVVCVGGGVGLAPLYPIVKALKEKGNEVILIAGARTKGLLIMLEKYKKIGVEPIITTDDGSLGEKTVVTTPLKRLCEKGDVNRVIAIGPPIMMKFCSFTTKEFNVSTIVSLNTLMIDGTGMCGCCRVSVDGKTKFVCVDGPDFDAHLVDWKNIFDRMSAFREFEKEHHHKCHIDLQLEEGKA